MLETMKQKFLSVHSIAQEPRNSASHYVCQFV